MALLVTDVGYEKAAHLIGNAVRTNHGLCAKTSAGPPAPSRNRSGGAARCPRPDRASPRSTSNRTARPARLPPCDGLGQAGGQQVQAPADPRGVAGVGDQRGDGAQVGVEQGGGVLALFGGLAGQLRPGGLQSLDELGVHGAAVA